MPISFEQFLLFTKFDNEMYRLDIDNMRLNEYLTIQLLAGFRLFIKKDK